MKLLGKRRKLGNQGLSLVELLCSIAILGMLAMVVSSVLVVSANSYRRENADTDAQQEAQLVANQITDLLIDSSTDGTTQVRFVAPKLTITQGNIGYEVVQVGSELKYSQYNLDADGSRYVLDDYGNRRAWREDLDDLWQLMAENLQANSFKVNDSKFAETGNVSVEMVYMKGTEEYPVAFNVTARNREQMPETIATVTLSAPSEIIQEPGQNWYRINAAIIGGTGTLSYSCEGQTDLVGTRVNADGTVVVGDKETANMFRVKVTAAVAGPSGTTSHISRYVKVYVRRATTVSVTGSRSSGIDCQSGAKYQLAASVDGNYMAQDTGKDYDTSDPSDPNHYVNPYQVYSDWDVVSNKSPATGWHWENIDNAAGTRTLVLDGNMQDGEVITVTAKAAHPLGVNKSATHYRPAAKGYWVLTKTDSTLIPGGGWLRQTDTAQATVNGPKVDALKAAFHGTRIEIETRFREYPGGTYGSYGGVVVPGGGWLTNIYGGDANNSMTINIRPEITNALVYNKAYEIQIRLKIVDNAGNQVWPTDTTPESEYMLTNVMQPVSVGFKSALLGFDNAYWNADGSAPTINMHKGDIVDVMEIVSAQGIEVERIANKLVYHLEKKNAAGVWEDVPSSEHVWCQMPNRSLKMKFDGDHFGGDYRVKVTAEQMPQSVLVGNVLTQLPATKTYTLWDEATGQDIFYFHINQVSW